MDICSRGHSGAAFSIILLSSGKCSIIPAIICLTKLESSSPGPYSRIFLSTIPSKESGFLLLKSHSYKDCIAIDLERCLLAMALFLLCRYFSFFLLPFFLGQFLHYINNLSPLVIAAIPANGVRQNRFCALWAGN